MKIEKFKKLTNKVKLAASEKVIVYYFRVGTKEIRRYRFKRKRERERKSCNTSIYYNSLEIEGDRG